MGAGGVREGSQEARYTAEAYFHKRVIVCNSNAQNVL